MPIAVKDLDGKVVFHIDGEYARDDGGKRVAEPALLGEKREGKLGFLASRWMKGYSAPGEKTFQLDLAPTDVSTPAAQASFGINDGECIADRVSRVRYVKHAAGVWYTENVGDATQLIVAEANLDGSPAVASPRFAPTTFNTVGYALAVKLPQELLTNADFDLKRRATRYLVERLRLAREKRVAVLLMTAANWAAANQVAVSTKWNASTGANPMADMFSGLAISALPVNTIVMPEGTAQYFFQNAGSTALRDYVQSGGEYPEVIYARSRYSVAGAYAYTWAPAAPSNVVLLRVPEDQDTIPTTTTFRWKGDGDSSMKDGRMFEGVLVREFVDKSTARGDTWVVVAHNDAEVMVSNQVGAILTGTVA